jgi:hypothetical protein
MANSWDNYLGGGYISSLEGYAKNYMDPNSQYNQGQYNKFKEAGANTAAQQYQGGLKMQAAGQNPFANEQYQSNMNNYNQQAYDAYNQQMYGNQQLGTGLLGMSQQARIQQANMIQQQKQWDREYKQHKWGQILGLAGTLGGGLLMGGGGGALMAMLGMGGEKGIGGNGQSLPFTETQMTPGSNQYSYSMPKSPGIGSLYQGQGPNQYSNPWYNSGGY